MYIKNIYMAPPVAYERLKHVWAFTPRMFGPLCMYRYKLRNVV